MANRVVHFEIEAENVDRAKKFYTDLFGWEMQQMGADMGNYVVIKTGDEKEPGGINGGMMQGDANAKQLNAYSCVISVDNIDDAIAKVKAAGGTVFSDNKTPDGKDLGEKIDIPGVGINVRCKDTEGNYFSLLQPSMPSSVKS